MNKSLGDAVPYAHRRLIGAMLREMRREAGLRQQDLADRLGVGQNFIARVESGDRQLGVLEARLVCLELGQSPEEFMARLGREIATAGDAPHVEWNDPPKPFR